MFNVRQYATLAGLSLRAKGSILLCLPLLALLAACHSGSPALVVGSFLGGLLAHLLLATRLVKRIQRLQVNAFRLVQGLEMLPMPEGRDEIGELGRGLKASALLLRMREQELREGEERFRSLFEEAPVAYHEVDQAGVIERLNKAECNLLGYELYHILGKHVWEFVAPEQRESTRELILRRLAVLEPMAPLEREFVRKDGSRITLEIHESHILDDQGQIAGLRSTLLDVTQRKMAELASKVVEQYARQLRTANQQLGEALAAAREATEAKSRFLANMSHELRTPLNGIIGFSELLYDGKIDPSSELYKEFLGDILTSARHLLQLINDVLDLAKVDSGKMEFRPQPVEALKLVHEVCHVLRPLSEKKRIRVEICGDVGEVITDPGKLKQVLFNYLSNAIKFTPDGGRVQIRLFCEGASTFRIQVEDTGSGIKPEDLGRLFHEFEQLADHRQEQGTGLGLALTKRIVEAQGGRVEAQSVPGQGSTFSAILPRVARQAASFEHQPVG